MTEWLSALILGALQGLTEFLPISSSAHLILIPQIAHWQDQGLTFDVAVHVGTLLAVVTYFSKPLIQIIKDFLGILYGKAQTEHSILGWYLMLATIPVGLAGWLFHDFIATYLRSSLTIGIATLGFGLVLGLSDFLQQRTLQTHTLTWKKVMLIGFAQMLALIPGTSRSGITITAGLSIGLSRSQAATFSFFLAIPVIILAGGYETYQLLKAPASFSWSLLGFGTTISFITAYLCIHTFLKFIEKIGMLPFVIYRILLGCFLLIFFL